MKKRNNNNGDLFRKKRLNLQHIAGSRKWQPFLQYVHDLIYAEDIIGNWAFLQETLIHSPTAVECRKIEFRGKEVVRVFYERKLPEGLAEVLKEKCLEIA